LEHTPFFYGTKAFFSLFYLLVAYTKAQPQQEPEEQLRVGRRS